MVAMITLRVRNKQALHDAADRTVSRSDQQMDVIAHQAISVQVERHAFLQIGHRLEECAIVSVAVEHRLAVVAAVDDVVHKTIGYRS